MRFILLVLILIVMLSVKVGHLYAAQINDPYTFNYKQVAIPTALIILGTTSLYINNIESLDNNLSNSISSSHGKLHFDDYIQYAPLATVLALDLLGVKARHKPLEQVTVCATAALTMFTIVQSGKYIIRRARPNNAELNSMPSGHTATAFMGAEFLRMEFSDVSPWIGVAGYLFATTTAYMRVYNNRHWITDTFVGAGVGILSVKVAYWLAPTLNQALWGRNIREKSQSIHASLSPYTTGEHHGVSCSFKF